MTIDAVRSEIDLKGNPSDEEVAALVTVLGGRRGRRRGAGAHELNLWGHPVDKLRYAVSAGSTSPCWNGPTCGDDPAWSSPRPRPAA